MALTANTLILTTGVPYSIRQSTMRVTSSASVI